LREKVDRRVSAETDEECLDADQCSSIALMRHLDIQW